jgi:acyl carrier protein
MNELNQEMVAFIAKHLRLPPEKVTPTAHFKNDLGADSLDIVEFIMTMEDKFDLKIDDQEVIKLTTPLAVQNYLMSKGRM